MKLPSKVRSPYDNRLHIHGKGGSTNTVWEEGANTTNAATTATGIVTITVIGVGQVWIVGSVAIDNATTAARAAQIKIQRSTDGGGSWSDLASTIPVTQLGLPCSVIPVSHRDVDTVPPNATIKYRLAVLHNVAPTANTNFTDPLIFVHGNIAEVA